MDTLVTHDSANSPLRGHVVGVFGIAAYTVHTMIVTSNA